jgi:membrane protein DedA with SNARE-associated domain
MTEFIQPFIDWYIVHINYWTIWLLMTIESSFIPFPSEIIMPPAWWKAFQWLLNPWLVLLSWWLGALFWALINYYLALWLWRKIIYSLANTRIAKILFINTDSIQKSEIYFRKHWKISTFIGRLIPAIRQLISIPAWLSKMNIWHFVLYTFLGASIWNIILFVFWYVLWQNWEIVKEYNHIFTNAIYWLIIILVLFFVIKYFYKRNKR